jgi:large subunit ribosomal protein L24
MAGTHIKRNDMVVVSKGRSAAGDRSARVLHVLSGGRQALVEGRNLVKKCLRKSQEHPQGGISEKEAPIAVSNLMLYCPECKRGVRVKRGRDGGKTVRRCKLCDHQFDG